MLDSPSQADLVLELAEEFLERYRKGERPALEEYIKRHPERAAEIREVFPAMAMLENIAIADVSLAGDATAPAATQAPTPISQLGDYRLIREVGRGGMGVVYEAEQISLGRHVALKVLPGHGLLNPTFLERFRREAKAAARLHHTNIVPVFGTGEDNGTHYYAMQFIRGETLDKVLQDVRQLRQPGQAPVAVPQAEALTQSVAHSLVSGALAAPGPATAPGTDPGAMTTLSSSSRTGTEYFRSAARLGVQVADALEYANKQGVLHRDIKPSNLLLDMHGTVWITDFGLAKADGDDLTHTGDIVGTIRYMAPERFDGKSLPQSDVYSLGLTLYEMVTLRPAFDGVNRVRLVEQVLRDQPTRPRKIDGHIPRDLETIILKCVAKDPRERYETANALAEDLRRFMADRTIQARRATVWEQTRRWARRNPAVACLLALIVILMASVSMASSAAAVRMRRLAQSEETARQSADLARDTAEREQKTERWGRYRSNIAAASGALQIQNSSAARLALDDAPPIHRNWEWHYLRGQLDGASLVIAPPGGEIKALALSTSGRQLAVCCFDHSDVYVYDVTSGQLATILRGHTADATSVAFRPDDKQIATIGNDQTLRLWDPSTGQQSAIFQAAINGASADRDAHVMYSPDGSRLASSAGWDSQTESRGNAPSSGTSRLWESSNGKEIAVLAAWRDGVRPVAFSPDGKQVAAGAGEFIHLCDAATGRRLAALGPHAQIVQRIVYSPDGKRIASSTLSKVIYLWDGVSGRQIAELGDHTAEVTSLHFSPDGSRLLTGSQYPDNTTRVWDAVTGRPLFELQGHKNEINHIAISADGKRIVTTSSDQTARLWNGQSGELVTVLGGHTDRARHVIFSPDGRRFVTSSDDATMRLWDAQSGELISVLRGHGDAFSTVPIFTPDGTRLVSGASDGTIRVWDMSLLERNGVLKGHTSYVYDVAFSPNNEQVASAAWDGVVRLWDATTGKQTTRLRHSENGILNSVAYSRDGRQLVVAERTHGAALWHLTMPEPIRSRQLESPGFWDNCATFNPSQTLVAAGNRDGMVRLWEVATGKLVAQLDGHESESKDVAFHPDGHILASTGIDHTVRLWDVATRTMLAVLRGHDETVWSASFSADGKLLASGSNDRTIRLWDVKSQALVTVIQLDSTVYAVAFHPDGTRLAAGCRDNSIRLIDVASGQQVAALRGHADYVHAVSWSPDGTRLASGSGDFTVRIWDSLSAQERARRAQAAGAR